LTYSQQLSGIADSSSNICKQITKNAKLAGYLLKKGLILHSTNNFLISDNTTFSPYRSPSEHESKVDESTKIKRAAQQLAISGSSTQKSSRKNKGIKRRICNLEATRIVSPVAVGSNKHLRLPKPHISESSSTNFPSTAQKIRAAIRLQACCRGFQTRNHVVLPRQIIPALKKHFQRHPYTKELAFFLCREINRLSTTPGNKGFEEKVTESSRNHLFLWEDSVKKASLFLAPFG
jgi:hypothetical protein